MTESVSERVNYVVTTVSSSKWNLPRPALNDFVATVRIPKWNLRRSALDAFVPTARVSKFNPRRAARPPGSPHSKKLLPLPSHLSVTGLPVPIRKYRCPIHFGKSAGTRRTPKLNLRRPAPRPSSPHSKKLKPLPSHLSVICFAAPAQRYLLSTRFGKNIIPRNGKSPQLFQPCRSSRTVNPASAPEDPFSALFSELQKQNTQSVRGH